MKKVAVDAQSCKRAFQPLHHGTHKKNDNSLRVNGLPATCCLTEVTNLEGDRYLHSWARTAHQRESCVPQNSMPANAPNLCQPPDQQNCPPLGYPHLKGKKFKKVLMLMPKMRHFGFKTRLCLLGRTQNWFRLEQECVSCHSVRKDENSKVPPLPIGAGPSSCPCDTLSSHFQLDPLRSHGATVNLYFSGSKMGWRQGPSAAAGGSIWRQISAQGSTQKSSGVHAGS